MKRGNSRKSSIIRLRVYVCLLFAAAAFTDVMQFAAYKDKNSGVKEPILSTVLFLLIYLSYKSLIVARELGRILIGKASGYDFVLSRIGRVCIFNNNGRKKIKRLSYSAWGGQTIMAEHEYNEESFNCTLYNYGGAAGGIFYFVLAVTILMSFKENVYAAGFINSLSIFALVILIKEIIVSTKNTHRMMKNSERRRCYYNWAKINYCLSQGIRFKDMDEELFIMPDEEHMNDSVCALIGAVNIDRALDKLDFDSAHNFAQYTLKYGRGLAAANKNMIRLQLIFCDLISGEKEDEIKELLDNNIKKLLKGEAMISEVSLIQYVYSLFYEHNKEEAEKYLTRFNESLNDCLFNSKIEKETEMLRYVKERYINEIYGKEIGK